MAVIKRLLIVMAVLTAPLLLGLLFTFNIIDLHWISNMQIQPSFRTMEDPLPLPARSIPVQGAGYIAEVGPPDNPVEPDEAGLEIGQRQYTIHCALCHGVEGDGQGAFSAMLTQFPPADLTAENARNLSDGDIFMIITHGIEGRMPALAGNIPSIENRWHVVNYVRQLQEQAP